MNIKFHFNIFNVFFKRFKYYYKYIIHLTSGIISNIQSSSYFQNSNIIIKIDVQFLDFHFKFYYNNLVLLVQKNRISSQSFTKYNNVLYKHFFSNAYAIFSYFVLFPVFLFQCFYLMIHITILSLLT